MSLWLAGPVAADALRIEAARFFGPTDRYAHLVLGKDHNWAGLEVRLSDGSVRRVLWTDMVFEDTAPRLVDVTGDGRPEVLTVESVAGAGARVAVYGLVEGQFGLLVATPPVGQGNRWYALLGAADLDGDGAIEIAFVDRPHLARVLRVWRYGRSDAGHHLTEVATRTGLTNHRIGEAFITGGIRSCGMPPEIILVDAAWQWIMSLRLTEDGLVATPLAPFSGRQSVDRKLGCD